jgi:hypothetical protein
MYIVNKDGTQNNIIQAYDEYSEEYGYAIECQCGDIVAFIPECVFLDLMNDGQFEVFVDDEDIEDDVDFDECDCPYCTGVRDGIEIGLDMAVEVIENLDDECGCDTCRGFDIDEEIMNDVKDSLLDIKSTMNELMEDGCYDEVVKLSDAYAKLFNLIY